MKTRYFIFLTFVCFSFSLLAQDPSYFTIGEDELANINVYALLYDDKTDILYAGTDRGLYKYTQNKFRLLPKLDGQIGDSFFQLKKDKNGDIFCCNLNGQIFKMKDGEISLYYHYPAKEIVRNFSFFFDDENNLITTSLHFIDKISPDLQKTNLYSSNKLDTTRAGLIKINSHVNNAFQIENGGIYFSISDECYNLFYSNGQLMVQETPYIRRRQTTSFFSLGGIPYKGIDQSLFNLNTKQQEAQHLDWKTSVLNFNSDRNNLIQLNNGSGIRFLEYRNDSIHELKTCFLDRFISCIAKNDQQTLFLGTFKGGIMVVKNWKSKKAISKFPYSGIVSSKQNDVYLSTRKGEIFKDNNGPKLFLKKNGNIDNLFYLENNYFIEDTRVSNLLTDYSSFKVSFRGAKDLVEIDSTFVLWASGSNIYFLFKNSNEQILPEFDQKYCDNLYTVYTEKRLSAVQYIKNEQNIYYTSNFGAYSRKWSSSETKLLLFRGKSFLGNDLEVYKNKLIIATENDGLLFFSSGKFDEQVSQKDGLHSNAIIKIKIKDDFLFIVGNNGFQLYNLLLHQFIEIGLNEGLMADRVINFSLSKDKIWLLDKEGYYSIDLQSLKTISKVGVGRIYLDSMLINKNKISLNQFSTLSHDQNALEIFFDYRDIETKSETKIWYKLEGVSEDWKVLNASSNYIEYSYLPPGSYSFYIKARYRGQDSSVVQYNFKVLAPFWLRWWFILFCILFIGFIISAIFYIQLNRIKRTRNRELKEQKLLTAAADSQLKAIRSQMNPHFIFNSLNSIQALVLRQDVEKSYDYIVMFSDLVRKTLHFSEQDFIPLKDEIAFLEIYLQLESLRMKEEFSYTITSIGDDSIQIPSLLNQPFLENAIHHGLLHKAGKKQLDVIFECSNGEATCTILDNGIGRSEALKIKERQKSAYESFSLNATSQRLQLLSEQLNHEYSYKIDDLSSDSGYATGTKVSVNFPFKHDY